MNVEQALHEIREKAALLRYIASSAAINPERPDPDVLCGMATVCEEIEQRTRGIAQTVPVGMLEAEI